ncbi:MAG TPA: hypothetical protein PLV92_14815, partial [Pirellulaceae bacterium]|nr:hypothetical protein [Pirellulaceae bacterium]
RCEDVLHEAAEQLKRDRASSAPPRPGVAEYLDLVRAVLHLQREQADRTAKDLIQELAQFIYRKQSRGAM